MHGNISQLQWKPIIRLVALFRTREVLNQAFIENDFMKNLETAQLVEIVECMYPVKFATGNTIIREGEFGSVVYVMEGKIKPALTTRL